MFFLDTVFGKSLLKEESNILYENQYYLKRMPILTVGDPCFLQCLSLDESICICEDSGSFSSNKMVLSRSDKLAIDQDSVKVVYLPHVIESHRNPHEILREVYRVLEPEGVAIITTLNPVGILSFARVANKIFKSGHKSFNMFSALKLRDWLTVLGFEVFSFQPFFYALPLTYNKVFMYPGRKWFKNELKLPFSHLAYMMVVSKREHTMTPIRIQTEEKELGDAVLET